MSIAQKLAPLAPFVLWLAVGSPAALADDARFDSGRVAFTARCALCHTVEPGATHTVGPNLAGVLSRDVASVAGFAYSGGLKAAGGRWDTQRLSRFLQDPKAFAPGNAMPLAGLKSDRERRALVCYLSGNAASPACQ